MKVNQKPGTCSRCGADLGIGEGLLTWCEDASCRRHFDRGGWHLRCRAEDACRERRAALRQRAEELLGRLQAAVGQPEVASRPFEGRTVYSYLRTSWIVAADGRVAVQGIRDSWELGSHLVVWPVAASAEDVEEAARLGLLDKVKVPVVQHV